MVGTFERLELLLSNDQAAQYSSLTLDFIDTRHPLHLLAGTQGDTSTTAALLPINRQPLHCRLSTGPRSPRSRRKRRLAQRGSPKEVEIHAVLQGESQLNASRSFRTSAPHGRASRCETTHTESTCHPHGAAAHAALPRFSHCASFRREWSAASESVDSELYDSKNLAAMVAGATHHDADTEDDADTDDDALSSLRLAEKCVEPRTPTACIQTEGL